MKTTLEIFKREKERGRKGDEGWRERKERERQRQKM